MFYLHRIVPGDFIKILFLRQSKAFQQDNHSAHILLTLRTEFEIEI